MFSVNVYEELNMMIKWFTSVVFFFFKGFTSVVGLHVSLPTNRLEVRVIFGSVRECICIVTDSITV